jgi:hypothetical protein
MEEVPAGTELGVNIEGGTERTAGEGGHVDGGEGGGGGGGGRGGGGRGGGGGTGGGGVEVLLVLLLLLVVVLFDHYFLEGRGAFQASCAEATFC